jgi:hypothetical protein
VLLPVTRATRPCRENLVIGDFVTIESRGRC